MLCTGDLLSGRYRLDEPIADGGMGEVWRATDVSLGRTVAVKVVRPALLTEPGFDSRFRAEARTMASLTHPNVVNVYDYGRSELDTGGRVAYLVMAYVDGEPLSRRIAEAGRLSVAETMSIVAQAADALHAAHTHGIVHRDVKPANLLVQPNGTVKLVDFGVARSPAVTQVTTANAILGTAMYMAPEQASGRPVSAATDIYALGAVAYHCLAGRPPFTGDGPLEIALRHITDAPPPLPADVPPAVQVLVARALAKKPADRYPTAAALAAAARAIRVGGGAARVGGGAVRSAVAAPVVRPLAAKAAPGAEVDPPTTPDLQPLTGPASRGPHRGPRKAAVLAVAGVAAAALIGLAGLGRLLGSDQPAGAGPVGHPGRSGVSIAPVANPSSAAPQPSTPSGGRTEVAVRASAPVSAPTPAPPTTPAGGATASPGPATSTRPNPTGQPSAPATTGAPAPTATSAAPTGAGPSPSGGTAGSGGASAGPAARDGSVSTVSYQE